MASWSYALSLILIFPDVSEAIDLETLLFFSLPFRATGAPKRPGRIPYVLFRLTPFKCRGGNV
jgi:hypothetical protein